MVEAENCDCYSGNALSSDLDTAKCPVSTILPRLPFNDVPLPRPLHSMNSKGDTAHGLRAMVLFRMPVTLSFDAVVGRRGTKIYRQRASGIILPWPCGGRGGLLGLCVFWGGRAIG